jgi:hypothetical protein
MSHAAGRETEPGFGICAPRALEVRYRFSFWSTKNRCHEELRWGHNRWGTNAHTGPAKPEPVYNRIIIENPLSLVLLGESADTVYKAAVQVPEDVKLCLRGAALAQPIDAQTMCLKHHRLCTLFLLCGGAAVKEKACATCDV